MSLQSTVTSKGQVTVPVEIRRRLGLKQGDRVEFAANGRETVLRRAPEAENPFENYKGRLRGIKPGKAAARRWVAGLRDAEERRR